MKSLLFSLTIVSLFAISQFKTAGPSSIKLDIPEVIDLNSPDLVAIQETIHMATVFAKLEVYDKYGDKVYQSQDDQILLGSITKELHDQSSPLLYVLKFNTTTEVEQLSSQTGQLIW